MENIFKPNLLQTILGRKKRSIEADIEINGIIGKDDLLGCLLLKKKF